jgi:heptosyltransferase-2
MRILIRATNWLGDAVMCLPAIRAIRDNFRGSEVSVLVKRSIAELYLRESAVDQVIPYDGHRFRTASALREHRFQLGILFPNSFDSALVFKLAGIPRIVGYNRDGRGLLLSDAIPFKKSEVAIHERYYYLELLQKAGLIDACRGSDDLIRLECAPAAAIAGREQFSKMGVRLPVIGVSPGAAYGGAKRWLPDRFAAAASKLALEMGGSVAIFGAPGDEGACAEVERVIQGVPAVNLACKTSLREFIDLAAACSAFLTNDSGSMHIASALGIPTVAIFGATNHITTGPAGALSTVVREPVPCSPCMKRECPIDHPCMTGVSAERVVSAAMKLIKL